MKIEVSRFFLKNSKNRGFFTRNRGARDPWGGGVYKKIKKLNHPKSFFLRDLKKKGILSDFKALTDVS